MRFLSLTKGPQAMSAKRLQAISIAYLKGIVSKATSKLLHLETAVGLRACSTPVYGLGGDCASAVNIPPTFCGIVLIW